LPQCPQCPGYGSRPSWYLQAGCDRCRACAGLQDRTPQVPSVEAMLPRFLQRLYENTPVADSTLRKQAQEKCAQVQAKMRKGYQVASDFSDEEALWGYVSAKFATRARMAADVLEDVLTAPARCVVALGGGPAAELLSFVVLCDVRSLPRPRLVVGEFVDYWKPIATKVGELAGAPFEYIHCDVTRGLAEEANGALAALAASVDVVILSFVLLETGCPTVLIRDLWEASQRKLVVIALDAGQPQPKQGNLRDLAGSLRTLRSFSREIGATCTRADDRKGRAVAVVLSGSGDANC